MIVPSTLDSSRRTGWPLSSTSPTYGALETASASARAYVRAALAGWRMAHMTDDAEAVVAELIANAVNASRLRQGGFIYINGKMPTIRVCLLTDGSELLIECWDEALGVPQLREIDYATAESGRGDVAEFNDLEERVRAAITALPARQRQVMALTLAGFKPAQIAEQLGSDEAAVRQNQVRGRGNLARQLDIDRRNAQ